tara:strand:+ start:3290 stop:4501 length:1212 start_codon:yes stop_codon:yes gene_type:complete
MISNSQVLNILSNGKPEPKNKKWYGEPNLGSYYGKEEINAVNKVLRDSKHWSNGFGPNSSEITTFEKDFANYCNVKYSIAVSNNGDGFDMVLSTLNLTTKDEIIAPSINFKAWHMALHRYRCKMVFCDIDINTMNIDLTDLEKKITSKTRLICPVHMGGIACDVDKIDILAKKYSKKYGTKICVVYDSARAAGVNYKKSKVGNGGLCEIFSFHGAKLMTTFGEGGMITTNNKSLWNKLKEMQSYGGEYSWGLNYRMSKVEAAFGIEQLKRLDEMNNKRIRVAKRRISNLKGLKNIILPSNPDYSQSIYYLFPILVDTDWGYKERNYIIETLEKKYDIVCSIPKFINKRWKFISQNYGIPELKNTEDFYNRVFCPIIHPLLNKKQELFISSAIINTINQITFLK